MLCGINFTAQPGQTTAIIGSTGSGKSTMINLIPRFYDVTEGQILIDGVDIRTVTQHDLREKIGYIPQKSVLFSGTIESNLRYANEDASQEVIDQAAEIAQVSEFIDSNTAGLDLEIARAAPTSPAGRSSAFPSPVRWSNTRRSTSLTTAFRRWTSRPTPRCAAR